MGNKTWIQTILTATIILVVTTALFLYTAGYRFERKKNTFDLKQTGMISAKSIPEGASVYINEVLVTATDDTVSALNPGTYVLKIVRKGYVEWRKELEVFPELVTDITAVLVSQSPRLEPLTNTGAKFPVVSPTLTKLAFFSSDPTTPGISVISLAQGGLSLFRSAPLVVVEDLPRIKYSQGKSIEWSPDERELLIEGAENTYYIVDLNEKAVESTSTPTLIKNDWRQELIKKRTDFIERLDLPQEIKALATSDTSVWSPDEKKFLFNRKNGSNLEYWVYNMEKPIPVGEKVENLVFTTIASDTQPKVSWYADSFHLILTENYSAENKRGTISLIRIDGTNKTEVYNNTLLSDTVYSSPGGDKLIILTSFKSTEQTDLYTIGIR